ncbi:hypothetical protein J2S55_004965 [Streptosporangium brasiliense]|uniref:Uncharacterized protein n=1 Tax=Streptosporangium brasiliense TaxID=47480 RepID=A0ABT9RAA8_9ACTN|nr:hypothetical protein [Streptosporangium brasiliense]
MDTAPVAVAAVPAGTSVVEVTGGPPHAPTMGAVPVAVAAISW